MQWISWLSITGLFLITVLLALLAFHAGVRLQVGEPAERNHTLERLNALQVQILDQSLLIGNKDGLTGSASSLAQSLAEIIDVHA